MNQATATETVDHAIRQLIGDTTGKTLTIVAMVILILRYRVVADLFPVPPDDNVVVKKCFGLLGFSALGNFQWSRNLRSSQGDQKKKGHLLPL